MCGKLIVAIEDSEVPGLEELYRRGTENGAEGLELIGPEELREHEPHVAGVRAIWSPNTGIIDFTKVSEAYSTEMREGGGDLVTNAEVRSISRSNGKHPPRDDRRRPVCQEHNQLRRAARGQRRSADGRRHWSAHHPVQG